MGPYVAVVVDSFRAALSNKVLWVALLTILAILAMIAPVGYSERLTTDFADDDFYNGTRFKALLARGQQRLEVDGMDSPAARLAALMPDKVREKLRRVAEGEELPIQIRVFRESLNKALDESTIDGDGEGSSDGGWYDAEVWESVRLGAEGRDLLQRGDDVTELQRRRLNRLRIEAAMPGVFKVRSNTSIRPTYLGFEFPFDLPLNRQRFVAVVNQWIVPILVSWLLGFMLVLLGIIVTAPIIPGMLQPGSLHLLLSKPISRGGLLMAKFVGGLSFVLICVTQLVVGLYLIAGFRLDIWNVRLLWIIPTSLLLFAVFYSVSVLAGLVFRSEVLSIGLTCVFGGICLVVGMIGDTFDGVVTGQDRLMSVAKVDGTLYAADATGELKRFEGGGNDGGGGVWVEAIRSESDRRFRTSLPVGMTDSEGNRWTVAVRLPRGRNPFGTTPELLVLDEGAIGGETERLDEAPEGPVGDKRDESGRVPELTVALPTGTTSVVRLDERRMVCLSGSRVAAIGIDQMVASEDGAGNGASGDAGDADNDAGGRGSSGGGLAGFVMQALGGLPSKFESVLPPEVVLTPPSRLAVGDRGRVMAVAGGDRIWWLEADEGGSGLSADVSKGTRRYSVIASGELPGQVTSRFQIAVVGGGVVVARDDEAVVWMEPREGELVTAETFAGPPRGYRSLRAMSPPRVVDGDRNGNVVGTSAKADFAVLDQTGDLRIHRVGGDGEAIWNAGDVDGIGMTDDGILLVAEDVDTVREVDVSNLQTIQTWTPSLSVWRRVDRYLLSPLRFVIPQTGELGDVIATAISGSSTRMMGDPSADISPAFANAWSRPLISCLGFLTVVMGFNWWFFQTRDF